MLIPSTAANLHMAFRNPKAVVLHTGGDMHELHFNFINLAEHENAGSVSVPSAVGVKDLAQGHSIDVIILLAKGFELITF